LRGRYRFFLETVMTPEQKAKLYKYCLKRWASMTPEQLDAETADQREYHRKLRSGGLTEFHRLEAIERAATKAALDRCRALADQIESELSKKRAEDLQNLTVLADFQTSLESAVEVLERTGGLRQIAVDYPAPAPLAADLAPLRWRFHLPR
jgi:flagellar motility protein MotE (MotC chaperone)